MKTNTTDPGKRWLYVPARYVFMAVEVVNIFTNSLMTGCIGLAITVMVRRTSSSPSSGGGNSTSSMDVCPIAGQLEVTTTHDNGGDFDWSELTQSYVTNGGVYGSLATMLIAAYIAQRWSPKMMITCTYALSIMCAFLIPVLAKWSVYALIIARILQGFASGAGIPATGQLESTWFPPEERQQLSGITVSAYNIGNIMSSCVTGVLIEHFGWEFVFYCYGSLSSFALMLWFFLVHDSPTTHPRISEEEKEYICSRIKKVTEVKLPVPWARIATSPPVWAYLSISAACTWTYFVVATELPTYLKSMLHYGTAEAGYLASMAYALSFTGQIVSSSSSQWLRRKGYISHLAAYRIFNGITTLGPAASMLAITQAGCNATVIVVLLGLTMLFHGAYVAGYYLNHMDLAINFVPVLVGICGTLTSLVGVVSPTVAGALINNNQTLTAWSKIFYVSAAVSSLPYIIFLVFGTVEEQPWNTPCVEKYSSSVANAKKETEPQTKTADIKDCKINVS